jgi:hypothetical protein
MPDEGGGMFDGGGSVQWEVNTSDDDGTKAETLPHGEGRKGRKNKGADKVHGKYFQVDLLVPEDAGEKQKFLALFTGRPIKTKYGDAIRVYLPVERRKGQIDIDWGASVQYPGSTGSL